MILLKFKQGMVIIPNLDDYSSLLRSGATRICFLEGKLTDNYVLLNDKNAPEPSYVDICEDVDGECVVTEHSPILSARVAVDIFDQAFVERFAGDADELAWADDLECILRNEDGNMSRWKTVQECGLSEAECKTCEEIYDTLLLGNNDEEFDENMRKFCQKISKNYESEIRTAIKRYRVKSMQKASEQFLSELQVEGTPIPEKPLRMYSELFTGELKFFIEKFGTAEAGEGCDPVKVLEIDNGPSWTFFTDDNDGYTDTIVAIAILSNGNLVARWDGERGGRKKWEDFSDGSPDDGDACGLEEFQQELRKALWQQCFKSIFRK